MASETSSSRLGSQSSSRVSGVPVLDWVVTCLSVLLVVGIVWDGVGHASGRSFAEEGFFVPSHVFFYSMFLGIVAAVSVATYRERRTGKTWVESVPDGYGYGVIGLGIFGVAGVADYFWHRTFGFEQGFEVLVSPSHLMIAVGATLFLSMPLRSAWLRQGRVGGLATVPVVVSSSLVLTIVTLFGGFLVPLIEPYPTMVYTETPSTELAPLLTSAMIEQAAMSLVAYSVFLLAVVLVLTRRFRLPPGAFTATFGVSAGGIVLISGESLLVLPAVVAGVVADAVSLVRPPTAENVRALRTVAVLLPVALAIAYFVVVEVQYGVDFRSPFAAEEVWSPHIVGGCIVLPGLAGLGLSYLVTPGLNGREGSA